MMVFIAKQTTCFGL